MTIMGLDFLKHKETQRSNLAKEAETYRSNVADETERHRSNLANEAETNRSNLAKEAETHRSNLARETETNRSNVRNELLKNKELGIKLSDLAEKIRHNTRGEDLDSLKITMSNLPKPVREAVGTVISKDDPTLGKAFDQMIEQGTSAGKTVVDTVKSNWPKIKSKLVYALNLDNHLNK